MASSEEESQDGEEKQCIMHVIHDNRDDLIPCTTTGWHKFLQCVRGYAQYESTTSDFAKEIMVKMAISENASTDDATIPSHAAYHYRCYKKFCDVSKIKRLEKQHMKKRKVTDTDEQELLPSEPSSPPTKKRATRLSTGSLDNRRSKTSKPHVLRKVCIICHSAGKHKKSIASGGVPKRECLISCETLTGGKLVSSANILKRTDILRLIDGKDLVAIEAKYHKRCYQALIKKAIKHEEVVASEAKSSLPYSKSFENFCHMYIDKKILVNNDVLTLSKLRLAFVKTVKMVEHIHVPNYRSHNLKKRIQAKYPQLIFKENPGIGDVVYSSALMTSDIVDGAIADSEHDSTSHTDTDDTDFSEFEDSRPSFPRAPPSMTEAEMRVHFHSSRLMANTLDDATKSLEIPWPPTAETSNLAAARQYVPFQLFNSIAWSCGLCSEPNNTQYVKLSESDERRVLSIAQDMIYLKSRGRLAMPKHTSLSMAVRHLTGSSQVVSLLNGLGHAVSPSVTLEHDTALALQQLAKEAHPLPPGIIPGNFTTLVWDNNDFAEETPSGKGTTHNTNGIIIQRSNNHHESEVDHLPIKRSKVVSMEINPLQLQPYFGSSGKHEYGPACIAQQLDISIDMHAASKSLPTMVDSAYIMLRHYPEGKLVPSWTGFNTSIVEAIPPKSKVGYLPVIDASPIRMDTVQTVLHRSKVYANQLHQDAVAVVFDQAIYAKAQKIRWEDTKENFKKHLVIRMGSFHTAMTYMACIGTRFKDAGLADIMVESGIVGSGAVGGVMNGHHYNRAVRCHKLTYEAFQRLRWEAFVQDLSQAEYDEVTQVAKDMHVSFVEEPSQFSSQLEKANKFHLILDKYQSFISSTCTRNPNFRFWSNYIDMVQHLLHFIRSARQGNWNLHLSCIRYMLPWMFAYNRTNYSRYLPAYYLEMLELPTTHPAVHQAFLNGEFVVQRQENHGFAQIPCDQTIETTFNRDTKTKGGLTGFTLSKGAVQRWVLSQPQRAAITNELKDMAGKTVRVRPRKDLSDTKTKKDEQDIQNIMATVTCMANPFTSEVEEFIQLSSGAIASPSVTCSIMNAHTEGLAAFITFVSERLQHKNIKFMAPIKRRKLDGFGNNARKCKTRVGALEVTVVADRKLFARLMLIGNVRKVDIRKMLEYCLGPYPLPISTPEGTLRKVNKASLLHHIESSPDESATVEEIPNGSIWVIDGMALFQALANRELPSTMGGFAKFILTTIVNTAIRFNSSSVHFVTDRYPVISIKNTERGRRAGSGSQRIVLYSSEQAVPKQWQKFLADGKNKEALVAFLLQEWLTCPGELLKGVKVFYANGDTCHALEAADGKVTAEVIPELACSHEEADTRMLLHANYISEKSSDSTVVIKSLDTDVFIITLGLCRQISARILFHTGKGMNLRTIDMRSLQRQITTKSGDHLSDALVGLHAFTGCDSVSGFHGKGKVKPAKLVKENQEFQHTFEKVGKEFQLDEALFKEIVIFVCRLYSQTKATDTNDARYKAFRLGTHDEKRLAPNNDALFKHAQRANYQAAIWRRSLIGMPEIPSPHGFGWKQIGTDLNIDWTSLPPAPDDVLNLISCKTCKKGCTGNDCSCHQNGLQCTELCKCSGCKNRPAEEDESEEEDGDELDEEGSDIEFA